jgi:hypothetical protein
MDINVSQMQNTVHKAKHVRKRVFVDMMETNALSMPKVVRNRNDVKVMEPVDTKRPLVVCLQKQDAKTLRTVKNMTIASKDTMAVSESNLISR